MLTFSEQKDKLINAYLKNEINPYDNCACFIGNLLNGNHGWAFARPLSMKALGCSEQECKIRSYQAINTIMRESVGTYTLEEIYNLEKTFMDIIKKGGVGSAYNNYTPKEEDVIFQAFSAALDHLQRIHESKGEVIEEFQFKQRKLQEV